MESENLNLTINKIFSVVLGRNATEVEATFLPNPISCIENPLSYFLSVLEIAIKSEDFQLREKPNEHFDRVSKQDIFYAYKFLLGRFPENTQAFEAKKELPSTVKLIETLISSREFKENDVLKSLVSLKRRPVGFERYARMYLRTTEKSVVVLTGCQGKMIADLIQAKTGCATVPNIYLNGGNIRSDIIGSGGKSHEDFFEKYDLIYTQRSEIFNALKSNEKLSRKARLMPLIEYVGFQPDQAYISLKNTEELIVGPLGEYHSVLVASAFYAGYSVAQTLELFNKVNFLRLRFDEISDDSRHKLMSQESLTGYPMRTLVRKWDASGSWMRTINHPKKFVLNDLVDYALELEGIPSLKNIDDFVIDDLSANVDWPVYPGLVDVGGTTSIPKFKYPKAFSPEANSAAFLSLENFVSLTFESLSNTKYDDVFCHQLGRKVPLDTFF